MKPIPTPRLTAATDPRSRGVTRKQFLHTLSGAAVATLWPVRPFAQDILPDAMRRRVARILREYDSQGDHRTGSAVDAESGRWLSDRVDDAGIVPDLEWMGFSRIDVEAAYVEVDGRRAEGVPLYDGGITEPEGVTGSLGPTDGGSGIGLAHVGPRARQAFRDYRHSTPQRAVVTVTGGAENGVPEGLALMNAPDFNDPFGPAVLQVSSHHRAWLTRAAAAGATARVVAHVTRRPEEVFNVTATLRGTQPALAPLIVITPRSGWWTCASERGGGIAVWLEMIRAMGAAPTPTRTTVFLASTGHELGHYGLTEFLRTRSRLIQGAVAWIHLGASFGAAIGAAPMLQASSVELRRLASSAMQAEQVPPENVRPAGDVPAGEVRAVHDGGGAYISLLGANGLFHHPHDRWPDAVDVDRIVRYARAFVAIGLQLANTP